MAFAYRRHAYDRCGRPDEQASPVKCGRRNDHDLRRPDAAERRGGMEAILPDRQAYVRGAVRERHRPGHALLGDRKVVLAPRRVFAGQQPGASLPSGRPGERRGVRMRMRMRRNGQTELRQKPALKI